LERKNGREERGGGVHFVGWWCSASVVRR
jgi:hypothetical protein